MYGSRERCTCRDTRAPCPRQSRDLPKSFDCIVFLLFRFSSILNGAFRKRVVFVLYAFAVAVPEALSTMDPPVIVEDDASGSAPKIIDLLMSLQWVMLYLKRERIKDCLATILSEGIAPRRASLKRTLSLSDDVLFTAGKGCHFKVTKQHDYGIDDLALGPGAYVTLTNDLEIEFHWRRGVTM
jgi:hypothetical protein